MHDLEGGTAQPQRLAKLEQNKDVIKETNFSIIPLAHLLVAPESHKHYSMHQTFFIFVSAFSINISQFLSLHVLFLRLYLFEGHQE